MYVTTYDMNNGLIDSILGNSLNRSTMTKEKEYKIKEKYRPKPQESA
jgi:hypothetical protein